MVDMGIISATGRGPRGTITLLFSVTLSTQPAGKTHASRRPSPASQITKTYLTQSRNDAKNACHCPLPRC
jgi:hypothetical protein